MRQIDCAHAAFAQCFQDTVAAELFRDVECLRLHCGAGSTRRNGWRAGFDHDRVAGRARIVEALAVRTRFLGDARGGGRATTRATVRFGHEGKSVGSAQAAVS